jgi:hypothetical protein
MASANFHVFCRALLSRKQITCRYKGLYREVCPHIVGHKHGEEKAQVFQFGGDSEHGLPEGGELRCFYLDQVEDLQPRDGAWFGDEKHKQRQTCVDEVYVHIDLSVGPQPGRT